MKSGADEGASVDTWNWLSFISTPQDLTAAGTLSTFQWINFNKVMCALEFLKILSAFDLNNKL